MFYTKCRPQDCDALDLALELNKVFVGYPLYKAGIDKEANKTRRSNFIEIFADISDKEYKKLSNYYQQKRGYKSQSTRHHNLTNQIEPGSIVLIPRIQKGVCYAGRINSNFQLISNPTWIDQYFDLRKQQGKDVSNYLSHIGDVIQTWSVEKWHEISFPAIPRWISYRLLSRNTAGIIHDLENPKMSAYEVLDEIIDLPKAKQYRRINNATGPYEALLNWVTPRSFEPLMVSLLQCEANGEDENWYLVGGSGDGGVDGIAVNSSGEMIKALQCKLYSSISVEKLVQEIKGNVQDGSECIVAILGGNNKTTEIDGVKVYGIDKIVELIKKHQDSLPIAQTLNIFDSKTKEAVVNLSN